MTTATGRAEGLRSLARFSLVVLVLCLPLWLVGDRVEIHVGATPLPLSALTFLAPTLAAVLVCAREGTLPRLWAVVRDLVGRYRWWAALAVVTIVVWVVGSPAGWTPPAAALLLGIVPAVLVGAVGEEVGWSAFGLDRAASLGAIPAAGLLALVWAAFHAVPYIQTGRPAWWVAGMLVQIVGTRALLVGGCLLGRNLLWPAVLGHATANLVWMLSPAAGAAFDPWRANLVLLPAGAVFLLLARRWRLR